MSAPVTLLWPKHANAIRALRRQVFIEEQAVPEADEWDDLDSGADHLGIWRGRELIAYARLLSTGKLTRMAVVATARRQGLARALLVYALDRARAKGFSKAYLHAQADVKDLYLTSGFEISGPQFTEAGIEHLPMTLALDSPPLRLQGPAEAVAALARIVAHTDSRLVIASRTLPAWLFGAAEVVEAISQVVRRHRRAGARILIAEPKLESGHALVQLAGHLPSKIELRRLSAPESPWRGFVAGDDAQLLYFSDEAIPAGFSRLGARAETRAELERFAPLWEYASEPEPNARRL